MSSDMKPELPTETQWEIIPYRFVDLRRWYEWSEVPIEDREVVVKALRGLVPVSSDVLWDAAIYLRHLRALPEDNVELVRVVDGWISAHCRLRALLKDAYSWNRSLF